MNNQRRSDIAYGAVNKSEEIKLAFEDSELSTRSSLVGRNVFTINHERNERRVELVYPYAMYLVRLKYHGAQTYYVVQELIQWRLDR